MKGVKFSPKTIGCLRLAEALHRKDRAHLQSCAEWNALYADLCVKYSEKAVNRKMEELAHRGYIEYGVLVRTGWLTDKGRAALASVELEVEHV